MAAPVAERITAAERIAAGAWVDIDGLAEFLDVPRSWVRDKVTAEQLPHRRAGRHVRFAPDDVAAIERAMGRKAKNPL